MNDTSEERRHGINEFTEKLAEVEVDVAVIKNTLAGQSSMRRVIWGMASLLLVQVIAGAVGYGEIQTKLDHIDLTNIERELTATLTVLAQHGTDLKMVRDEQLRIRGMMDNMRTQFSDELTRRTKDRFYKSDWSAGRLWINEKFENQRIRIEHLEKQHHQNGVQK